MSSSHMPYILNRLQISLEADDEGNYNGGSPLSYCVPLGQCLNYTILHMLLVCSVHVRAKDLMMFMLLVQCAAVCG